MLKLLAFGAGAGAGIQAWRNFPADGPVSGDTLAVVFGFGLLFAYLGGRWHGRHGSSSVAVASASATAAAQASNRVQVFNVIPGSGATPSGVTVPIEGASWMVGERAQVSADDLDGLDLSELVEHVEHEHQTGAG